MGHPGSFVAELGFEPRSMWYSELRTLATVSRYLLLESLI